MMTPVLPYKRILLKLSGELLLGNQPFGISCAACQVLALTLKEMCEAGLEVAVVIGGGNIFRGISLKSAGMARTPADQMGMLATMMNGLALHQALESISCKARVMSALDCPAVVDSYNWGRALTAMQDGELLIFVGGTGNPYFSTDSAAALRACEIQADIVFKATKVDGIYSKDPLKYADAVKYDRLSYSQVLAEKLEVMDATAITLCRNSQIPIFVFNMNRLGKDSIAKIFSEKHGTLVNGE